MFGIFAIIQLVQAHKEFVYFFTGNDGYHTGHIIQSARPFHNNPADCISEHIFLWVPAVQPFSKILILCHLQATGRKRPII